MEAAEQEAARAKELTRLNTSAKGFRSQFVKTRKVLARKYESTEVACKEKDTINKIFVKKKKKRGKATPSQPV
jgi:hypothetical protein